MGVKERAMTWQDELDKQKAVTDLQVQIDAMALDAFNHDRKRTEELAADANADVSAHDEAIATINAAIAKAKADIAALQAS